MRFTHRTAGLPIKIKQTAILYTKHAILSSVLLKKNEKKLCGESWNAVDTCIVMLLKSIIFFETALEKYMDVCYLYPKVKKRGVFTNRSFICDTINTVSAMAE